MFEYEKQDAVKSFLKTELDKCRLEIGVLEAKLKDAYERKQAARIIYTEVTSVETKDARAFLENALKCGETQPSDVVVRLLKFMNELDGADETPGETATEAETKTAKDETKADEKPAVKSPSQVLCETIRALRRFSDYEARRVVLALYGYFVTVEDDYSKRRS